MPVYLVRRECKHEFSLVTRDAFESKLRRCCPKWRVCRGCNDRCRTSSVDAIRLDTHSHAIPAMQEEAAALIAGLVFAE
jgi:hypothetical protein